MKYLKLLVLLPSMALADGIEMHYSFLTTHIIGSSERVARLYKNKVNNSGVITNKALGYSLTLNSNRYGIFIGENSVGLPIYGFKYSRVFHLSSHVELNFTAGAYHQNGEDFPEATKTCGANGCTSLAPVPSIVPIIGVDLNFYLYRGSYFFVKQNNLLTPIITNHGISVGSFFN